MFGRFEESACMQESALSHERPFPGLRPFAFADHLFFFGRDDQVYAIYRLLDRSRFIAVVGASGSGKSSLVRAGLLPLLHEETVEIGSRRWKCFELHPGDSPITSLINALVGAPPRQNDEIKAAIYTARRERIAYAFRQSSFGLIEALADVNDVEGRSILLLVDQFEELFRFSSSDRNTNRDVADDVRRREESAHFVQLLLEASRSRDPKIHVLITMRSDFIGDCARFHGLPEAVSATQFLVPSLTRDQREEVIRKPIEKACATIDAALVERLLNDSSDEFDLPVLQHCLMRLWEEAGLVLPHVESSSTARARAAAMTRHLRIEHYEKIGRIARALSLHADAIMASLPGLELAVEQTFRALSDVDKNGRATRRALSFEQIVEESGIPEGELRQVVDRFRGEDCSFLVPAPSSEATLAAATRIDVGHESLLRRWERISSAPAAEIGNEPEAKRSGWLAAEEADGRTYRALLALIESAPGGSRVTLPLDQVESRAEWWNSRKRTEAWAERYGGSLDRVQQLFEDSWDALKSGQRSLRVFDIVAPTVFLLALVVMVFWVTYDAIGWTTSTTIYQSIVSALTTAMAAGLVYGAVISIVLKGRSAKIAQKVWREGSWRCLIPIAIKAGLVTFLVIVLATVYWKFSDTWQSVVAIAQLFARSAADTGATSSTPPEWAYLPIKMATALPWVLVGMTASLVLVVRLSGDVRRIGMSDRLRDAMFLAVALCLAAAAAQLIQTSLVDTFRDQGLSTDPVPSLRLVWIDGLAEFVCGAVVGFMVPQACRANLVTPSDPITARVLRDLLREARATFGSKGAAEDWVFMPNGELGGITPAEAVQYKRHEILARRLLESEGTRRRRETRSDPPVPVVIEGRRDAGATHQGATLA
jgi:energy-coupling factor transporter ATP-binding protein EcfA2